MRAGDPRKEGFTPNPKVWWQCPALVLRGRGHWKRGGGPRA